MTNNVTFNFVFLILSSYLLGSQATRALTTMGYVTLTPTEDATTSENTVITGSSWSTATITDTPVINEWERAETTPMPLFTENFKSDDTVTYESSVTDGIATIRVTNPTLSTPTSSVESPSNPTMDIQTTVDGGKELESVTSTFFVYTTPIMTTGTATLTSVTDITTRPTANAVTTKSSTTTNAPTMTTSIVSPSTKMLSSEERTTERIHPETETVTVTISSRTTSSLTEPPSTTTGTTNGISTTDVDANYATTEATDQPATSTSPSIVDERTITTQLSKKSTGPGMTTQETTEGDTSQPTSSPSMKTTESGFNEICLETAETMNHGEEVENLISVVMATRNNVQIIDLKKQLVRFVVDTMNEYFKICGQGSTAVPLDSMVSSELKPTVSDSRVVAVNDVVILNEAQFPELLTITITFYVKDRRNPANCSIFPAFFVLKSVKRKRSQMESLLRCNITQIVVGSVKRWKESTPGQEEHYDWKVFNTRYEPLIFALMAVVGVCLSVAMVAALWIRCSRLNGSYSSEDGYGLERDILKEVHVKSDEFDGKDLTSEREILQEERDTEKKNSEDLTVIHEPKRPRNLNLTLITADDGWVVPFKDIPLDGKVIRPNQDTKL